MGSYLLKIGLGTVQLGIPYGAKAGAALMSEAEAHGILAAALDEGVEFIDTAASYGKSESRIGHFFAMRGYGNVEVSTKIPVASDADLASERSYFEFVTNSIRASCRELVLDRLHLLQFHQCSLAFLTNPLVKAVMQRLIEDGYCRAIGVSVYDPEEAEAALEIPAVNTLQIPVNILDNRFTTLAATPAFRKRGIRFLARSILLQGLLVDDASIPDVKKAGALRDLKASLKDALEKTSFKSLEELSLQYVFHNCASVLAIGLLGVDSIKMLHHNFSIIRRGDVVKDADLAPFADLQAHARTEKLVNPATWSK